MADMTREQLQGAVMALRYMHANVGLSPVAEQWLIDNRDLYEAQLAALPPQPDLRAALVEARAALGSWRDTMNAPDMRDELEAAREALKAARVALDKLDRYSTCTHLDMGGKHKYHIQVPYQTEIVEESKQAIAAIAAFEEKHGTR
jgi:hypothetical protein